MYIHATGTKYHDLRQIRSMRAGGDMTRKCGKCRSRGKAGGEGGGGGGDAISDRLARRNCVHRSTGQGAP